MRLYESVFTGNDSISTGGLSQHQSALYLCEDSMNLSPAHDQFGFLVSDQLQALELLQRARVQRLQDFLPGLLQ